MPPCPSGNVSVSACVLAVFIMLHVWLYPVTSTCASVPVILDTDLASDADDAGALAVLHGLAELGEAEILAVMLSSANPAGPSCAHALNRFFGRPGTPVGLAAADAPQDDSSYTHILGAGEPAPTAEAARSLYRRLLAAAEDGSVVIVSVGYLGNLRDLLASPADAAWPEDGLTLIQRKVRRLVVMGGKYPAGREWNFQRQPEATVAVLRDWPGSVLFCGVELGLPVVTGTGLAHCSLSHPLRRIYEVHNQLAGRPSWDQLAVLAAIRPDDPVLAWREVRAGRNTAAADGGNRWLPGGDSPHAYLRFDCSAPILAALIEGFMCQPAGRD